MHSLSSNRRVTIPSQKALIGTSFLLVAIVSFLVLVLPFQSPSELRHALHILRFGDLPKLPTHTHCIIYDKTPRTGSSTVSGALRGCLRDTLKFSFPTITSQVEYNRKISHTLNQSSERVALAGTHLRIPPEEIIQLRRSCTWLFYITSTRPMTERLASRAKSYVSSGKTHLNTSLSADQMKEAWDRGIQIIDDGEDEKRMERYPFDEWEINPDFVIRSDHFKTDLSELLQAFNCSGNFYSKNMHAYEEDNSTEETSIGSEESKDDTELDEEGTSDGVDTPVNFDDLPIRLGDARHKRMMSLAEHRNERGLGKVIGFVNTRIGARDT